MPSATSQEPDNEGKWLYLRRQSTPSSLSPLLFHSQPKFFDITSALPQNGLTHSSTNIDEFIPEDELDAGFLDEDGGSRGKKRTNKSAAKKPPPKPVEAEQNESDDSERWGWISGFNESRGNDISLLRRSKNLLETLSNHDDDDGNEDMEKQKI